MESAMSQLVLEKVVLECSLAEAEKLLGQDVKKNGVTPSSKPASNIR
jgi:hypothetical protein